MPEIKNSFEFATLQSDLSIC